MLFYTNYSNNIRTDPLPRAALETHLVEPLLFDHAEGVVAGSKDCDSVGGRAGLELLKEVALVLVEQLVELAQLATLLLQRGSVTNLLHFSQLRYSKKKKEVVIDC